MKIKVMEFKSKSKKMGRKQANERINSANNVVNKMSANHVLYTRKREVKSHQNNDFYVVLKLGVLIYYKRQN